MKKVALALKALTFASAAAMLVMFFFNFVTVASSTGTYDLTGFEIAFGSKQTLGDVTVNTYKGAYYAVAFVLTLVTTVFAAVSFVPSISKKHGAGIRWATFGFSAATALDVCVVFFSRIFMYLDIRPVEVAASAVTKEVFFVVTMILSLVTLALSAATVLVSDNVAVSESNGAKISIPRRIKRFFKDYKREIKNIVWPTPKTVLKNCIVVAVMCLIIGAFIWVLDFGLTELLKLIY